MLAVSTFTLDTFFTKGKIDHFTRDLTSNEIPAFGVFVIVGSHAPVLPGVLEPSSPWDGVLTIRNASYLTLYDLLLGNV